VNKTSTVQRSLSDDPPSPEEQPYSGTAGHFNYGLPPYYCPSFMSAGLLKLESQTPPSNLEMLYTFDSLGVLTNKVEKRFFDTACPNTILLDRDDHVGTRSLQATDDTHNEWHGAFTVPPQQEGDNSEWRPPLLPDIAARRSAAAPLVGRWEAIVLLTSLLCKVQLMVEGQYVDTQHKGMQNGMAGTAYRFSFRIVECRHPSERSALEKIMSPPVRDTTSATRGHGQEEKGGERVNEQNNEGATFAGDSITVTADSPNGNQRPDSPPEKGEQGGRVMGRRNQDNACPSGWTTPDIGAQQLLKSVCFLPQWPMIFELTLYACKCHFVLFGRTIHRTNFPLRKIYRCATRMAYSACGICSRR